MPVQIYKPDPALIAQLAAKAKESVQGGGDSKYNWGNLAEGDTYLRICPPTNSRGDIKKRIYSHGFRYSPLKDLIEGTLRCTILSHPDTAGTVCPIHEAGDRLKASNPAAKINGWHSPRMNDYIQAINRADVIPVAKIWRLPPTLSNELFIHYDRLLQQAGVDLSDADSGIDIVINRSEVRRRGGKGTQTKYSVAPWTIKGTTPLHEDPQVKQTILESLVDLDDVFKFPNDEKIAEMHEAAGKIMQFYARDPYAGGNAPQALSVPAGWQQQGAQPQPAAQPVQVQQPQPAAQPVQVQHAPPVQPQQVQQPQPAVPYNPYVTQQAYVTRQQAQADAPTQPVQPQPAAQPVQVQQVQPQQPDVVPQSVQPVQQMSPQQLTQLSPVPVVSQQAPVQQVIPEVQQVDAAAKVEARNPMDNLPDCFGSAAPRKDGGVGYDFSAEVCLTCPFDAQCDDACKPDVTA